MMEILASAAAMGIITALASLVHWLLNKWRPGTSWRTSILVTIVFLFLPGLSMALLTP